MAAVKLTIDGKSVSAPENSTILEAAHLADIYIPTLCHHPDLPPAKGKMPAAAVFHGLDRIKNALEQELAGCGLCVVEIKGQAEPVQSCVTPVQEGLVVTTDSVALKKIRQEKLMPILARHPHACLACAQAAGCSRTQCSSNVPEDERCCPKLNNCELQAVVQYVGMAGGTPRWIPTQQPVLDAEPLFVRDYNLCIGCTRCVRACEDLRGVGALGFVFDAQGRVQVGALAPTLAQSDCRFCTACVEVCPTGAIVDKRLPAGSREEVLVPCRSACPAGLDVPEYLRRIAAGRPDQASAVIRQRVPLPGVLGRVCVHPCEDKCRRGEVNEPLSICLLKRYAADVGEKPSTLKSSPTGKKVAVVGAGPAGLSAGFFLAHKGHEVTVFDAEDRPGGMLRYGIPAFRLPEEVLETEIQDICDLGVQIKTGCKVKSLRELKSQGFDAVFLSVGAQFARRLDIPGADLPNVLWGLDFLRAVRQGRPPRIKSRMLVVGGGNVAVDVALSALRLGATQVEMVCLEKRLEMPAHAGEILGAEAEGVVIHNSWGPKEIRPDGTVCCKACTRVFDEKGRFNPSYHDSKTQDFAADQVILAIGQTADLSFLDEGVKVSTRQGLIVADEDTLATGEPGVFAGGDAVKTPGAVVEAIAAGRQAAAAIDKYLGGDGDLDFSLAATDPPAPRLGRVEGFAGLARWAAGEREPAQRKTDFDEICLGLTSEQARQEAGRCLQCDLRLMIRPAPRPPEHVLALNQANIDSAPATEGVYVLFDAERRILAIKGVMDLKAGLSERLQGGSTAVFFEYEQDPMFSKAESERIQAYLQKHGAMPPGDGGAGGDDLDDLF